jgi:hypothetical protein
MAQQQPLADPENPDDIATEPAPLDAGESQPVTSEIPTPKAWAMVDEHGVVKHLDIAQALTVAQTNQDQQSRAIAALVVHAYRMGIAMGSCGI